MGDSGFAGSEVAGTDYGYAMERFILNDDTVVEESLPPSPVLEGRNRITDFSYWFVTKAVPVVPLKWSNWPTEFATLVVQDYPSIFEFKRSFRVPFMDMWDMCAAGILVKVLYMFYMGNQVPQ